MNRLYQKIHVLGPSGAGVTTLGRRLSELLGFVHLDTDDYYWFTSDPEPYRRRRNPDHRRQLLRADLEAHRHCVLTGSICGWGDEFASQFDLLIYCYAPVDLRLSRIAQREIGRYGADRLVEGGDLHGVYQKFLRWAADYDNPENDTLRSKKAELAWLLRQTGKVIYVGI